MVFELRGDEPVDRVFLEYLERYRKQFAHVIYHDNKKNFPEADTLHGAAKLTEAVQRLIDRLVFMRVCEDRGVAAWGGLKNTLDLVSQEGGDLFTSLCADFRMLDVSYNGYLFKPHFSEELQLCQFWPRTAYLSLFQGVTGSDAVFVATTGWHSSARNECKYSLNRQWRLLNFAADFA